MRITRNNYGKIPKNEGAEAVSCKNGFSTLLLKKDGRERLVHSKYDPVGEARKQLADFLPEAAQKLTILVFGLGMAYHVYEILNSLPEGGTVCVFEPNPYVCRLFIETNGESILSDGRTALFCFSNTEELIRDMEGVLRVENCDAFSFFAHPVCTAVFPSEHDAMVDTINANVSELSAQKRSIRQFGKLWSLNFLANLKHLFKSAAVKGLYGLFKDETAIIVSAGPSLSKNVALLKNADEKAVIICTDTAYKALDAIGIKPHLLVTASGSPFAYEKLRGMDCADIPFVYKSQSSREIIENHGGKKFYAANINEFLDKELERIGKTPGTLESGGSVACSCLDLAVKMGVARVILIGQDFALTDGESYAEGVYGAVTQYDLEMFSLLVPDIYGKPVKTLKNLDMYRRWFEGYIRTCPDIRFIDATEGGALISGTEIMTFSEALAELRGSIGAKARIDIAYLENKFSEKTTRNIILKEYKSAFSDYEKAKKLLSELIGQYRTDAPSRAVVIRALEKLYIYTYAIRYSVLAEIYDIKNMVIGKNPEKELASLKDIALTLEGLSESFQNTVR